MKLFQSIFYDNKNVIILVSLLFFSCSKNDGGSITSSAQSVSEEQILFKINPDPGSTIMAALAASQDFALTITSKMPASGVKVDLQLTKDLDGTVVFSQSLVSTQAGLSATFQNLVSGVIYTGTIKVTSSSNTSNSSSKTFKIAKK